MSPELNVPFEQEAEEAVIGAVLIDPSKLLEIASFLKPDAFYLVRHQLIWSALNAISARDDAIDVLTLGQELRGRGQLDDVGGPAYLSQLVSYTPTSIHAEAYGRLIERAALRRRMLAAADAIKALALDDALPAEQAYLTGMQHYDAIRVEDRQHYLPGALSIGRYDQIIDELAQREQAGERIGFPLPPAWHKLADALPAIYPGDFIVVSGPPGSGKSALLESWAEHCAALGQRVHYIHTEMSTEQILHRRMARHSGLPYHLLASGKAVEHYERLLQADSDQIFPFAQHIAYHWMPDVAFARLAQEMRLSAMRGTRFFFIDHFQDVQPPAGKGASEVRAFEEMCVWLAAFAEYRRVVVVMASQQNEQGQTKWTRKLVEKAVTWISLKRGRLQSEYCYLHNGVEVRAQPGEDSPEADVIINKARFGKKGRIRMLYHGPSFLWLDMAQVRRPYAAGGKVVSLADAHARASDEREALP